MTTQMVEKDFLIIALFLMEMNVHISSCKTNKQININMAGLIMKQTLLIISGLTVDNHVVSDDSG